MFGGDTGLFSLGGTGGSNGEALVLYRNCVSIVTIGRTNFAGTITALKATLANRRTILVGQCTSRIVVYCSTSRTNRGTATETVPVLEGSKLGIGILAVPDNGSPSRFVGSGNGSNPTTFGTLLSGYNGSIRCQLRGLGGTRGVRLARNGITFLRRTTGLVTAVDDPVRQSICSSGITSRLKISGGTFGRRISEISHENRETRRGGRTHRVRLRLDQEGSGVGPRRFRGPHDSDTRRTLLICLLGGPSTCRGVSTEMGPRRFRGALVQEFFRCFDTHVREKRSPLAGATTSFARSRGSGLCRLVSRTVPKTSATRTVGRCVGIVGRRDSGLGSNSLTSISGRRLVTCLSGVEGGGRWARREGVDVTTAPSGGAIMERLVRLNGRGNRLAGRSVLSTVNRVSFSPRRLRGLCSSLTRLNVRVMRSSNSVGVSSVSLNFSRDGSNSSRTRVTRANDISISSPMGMCLGRVKQIPLLSSSRRVGLTVEVTSNSITTGRHLSRTGLHLIISVTGHCLNENVRFLSLVRRNGLNLVGTMRGFSCAGNFGFSACTA